MNNKSTHIVIGVENPGNVLSQVSVQHGLDVATDINCGATAVTDVWVLCHCGQYYGDDFTGQTTTLTVF